MLNDTDAEKTSGPTFIAAFSGYASLNIPVQFSSVKPTAPEGLPIGMMLVASNFPKMLKIASYYENAYLIEKKFPKSVPDLMEKKCYLSNSESIGPNFIIFLFFIFLTL
jgi:hypothetical protein